MTATNLGISSHKRLFSKKREPLQELEAGKRMALHGQRNSDEQVGHGCFLITQTLAFPTSLSAEVLSTHSQGARQEMRCVLMCKGGLHR